MAGTTPTVVVVIGMAGSGKTTFMQQISSYLHSQRTPSYLINLDPAVRTVPFDSNIDIRDSIDYKEVMQQYNLGPNGGILTSLNLFATKVDQVITILEKRCGITSTPDSKSSSTATSGSKSTPASSSSSKPAQVAAPKSSVKSTQGAPPQHILIDTPGQIEVFVWSASGTILLSALASSFPTVLAYVIDTPRSASTATFMANMLYACSILYKTRLPMILVFNKSDVKDPAFAHTWMTDFEAFQAALRAEEAAGAQGGAGAGAGGPVGSGYMSSLLHSMSMVLEEFYAHLSVVGVSAATGQGVGEFFAAVAAKAGEFEREYRPALEARRGEVQREKEARREREMGRLMRDLNVQGQAGGERRGPVRRPKREPETISDMEDDDDDEEDEEPGLVDPDEEEGADEDEDDAIAQRYRQAIRHDKSGHDGDDGAAAGGVDPEFLSFERYIRKSQMGGGGGGVGGG